MGFFSALTLLFIFLKVTGYTTASWWWVIVPCAVWLVIYSYVTYIVMNKPWLFFNKW